MAAMLLLVPPAAAGENAALAALSKQLAAERTNLQGTSSESRCPDRLAEFVGLSRLQVHQSLGSPDTFKQRNFSPPTIAEATYFIAPKLSPGARGGGHPEVTFHFSASERVTEVTCALAR
jgi:hypothetical protein